MRYGLGMAIPDRTEEWHLRALWERIDATGICWEWMGAKDRHGYGVKAWLDKRTHQVHRLVWEQLVGPIPEGMVMDHLCRNPPCCNPDHLRVVTRAENNVVNSRSFAGQHALKTHCPQGHAYDEHGYRDGPSRKCRICVNARNRAAHHARKRMR